MVTNDATLLELKHLIMESVARLAWDDAINEESLTANIVSKAIVKNYSQFK